MDLEFTQADFWLLKDALELLERRYRGPDDYDQAKRNEISKLLPKVLCRIQYGVPRPTTGEGE